MMFMNTSDIEDALVRHAGGAWHEGQPVRLKAAQVVAHLASQANQASDGWHSWPKPCRAAAKMQAIASVRGYANPDATEADYRKALSPIKALYTKWGNKAGMAPIPEHLL